MQFLQQLRHYQSTLQVFKHQPDKSNKDLAELVMFLAQVRTLQNASVFIGLSVKCTSRSDLANHVVLQVGHCYLTELSNFPKELTELLLNHHTVLEPDLRMVRLQSCTLLGFHTEPRWRNV